MPYIYIQDIEYLGEKLPLYAVAGDLVVKYPEDYYVVIDETSKVPERELPRHLKYIIDKYKIEVTWTELLDKLFESVGSKGGRFSLGRLGIIDSLKRRKTFVLERPLVETLGLNPQVIGVRGVDASLEAMKDEKKREWRAKGYSEKLINMATELAQEWAYKMSEVFAPPEMREAAVRYNLPKGLEVADAWITKLGEAIKASR